MSHPADGIFFPLNSDWFLNFHFQSGSLGLVADFFCDSFLHIGAAFLKLPPSHLSHCCSAFEAPGFSFPPGCSRPQRP